MTPNPVTHRSDGTTAIHILYKAVPYDCIIDTVDYPKVVGYRWNVKPDHRGVWRVFTTSQHLPIYRVLTGLFAPDHKNHNGLDNRRLNLRESTRRQQACNRRKRIGDYTSKYKGVSYRKDSGKWRAKIDNLFVASTCSTEIEADRKSVV